MTEALLVRGRAHVRVRGRGACVACAWHARARVHVHVHVHVHVSGRVRVRGVGLQREVLQEGRVVGAEDALLVELGLDRGVGLLVAQLHDADGLALRGQADRWNGWARVQWYCSLSLSLSIYLSISLSLFPVCVSLSSLSVSLPKYLPLCLCVSVSLPPSLPPPFIKMRKRSFWVNFFFSFKIDR